MKAGHRLFTANASKRRRMLSNISLLVCDLILICVKGKDRSKMAGSEVVYDATAYLA